MAREILQKHDQTCSSRTVPHVAHALGHHEASVGWLPVGSKWRKLRKISREHMFTMHKLQASAALRQDKLRQLQDFLAESCSEGRVVNFEEVAFVTALNLISTTMFSVDFARLDSDSSHQEMKEIIQGLMNSDDTDCGCSNRRGFQPTELTDCQQLFWRIFKRENDLSFIGDSLLDIFGRLNRFSLSEISWVPRNENSIADSLAKHALLLRLSGSSCETFPVGFNVLF
ncbi:cytochrome P450 76T24-like [Salvia miltiorrhiza]|uniref:cytochrome P450 76T24-like n=1 Tax=Salvia miltiorrhiza TaxID=226208 RepID=UPI0025AC3D47|nr:cytochrome P450 76T24-like [Salvia miltiorrhiza]